MSDHSPIIHQIQEARSRIKEAQRQGLRVGVVPTMGALHEGHLSLIDASEEECDRTVVWIFVNPTQFAPTEDLEKYPRTLQADTAAVGSRGAWFVFAPEVSTIYPAGFSTFVEPPSVAGRWEGEFRPTHFRGVSTVVLKLLQILPADRAYFGEKDFQQLQVIRAMANDFHLPTEIIGCPIVRDADGLALSSRNQYLSDDERKRALTLSCSLQQTKALFDAGERSVAALESRMKRILEPSVDRIDYAVVVDAVTLKPIREVHAPAVALIAAYVGSTRLIDNCQLP